MKNIQKMIKNIVLARNIRKSISSTSLGCVVIAGVLGFTTLVPAYTVMAETAYTEKVVFDITAKVPSYTSIDDIKAKAIKISPESNPDLFLRSPYSGTDIVKVQSLPLDGKVRYYESKNPSVDGFNIMGYVVTKIIEVLDGSQLKGYKLIVGMVGDDTVVSDVYLDPSKTFMPNEFYDKDVIDLIKSKLDKIVVPAPDPKPEPIPTPEPKPVPTPKMYTSTRLGGIDRYATASAIANRYNSGKVNAVILTSGLNFPDALTGSTLAAEKNAPILLVGSANNNSSALTYIKNHLNSNGTVYILGGTGIIPDSILSQIKSYGFKDFKRLGGIDRYATNLAIVNSMNVPKGTNIVIANSLSFADSLSISGIAGAKGMPIFLVNQSFDSSILAKIKSIDPANIYVVGGTGAVPSSVENQLKSIGKVTRLGGINRYETSLNIAKYFTTGTTTTTMFATGYNFPDALAGSVLASKYGAPILLVNDNVKSQKAFIDGNKIKDLFILGDKGVISDTLVNQLKK